MDHHTASASSRSLLSGRNNPYLVLENTWQMTKRQAGAQAIADPVVAAAGDELDQLSVVRPVSPISIGNGSCSSASDQRRLDTAKRLNLSAICISNILMLEDRHLPSIFIRMYEQCLIINEQDEANAENRTRLRLLNYLIQRWHETRSRLNFYRDVMRVAGALARPILGDHINIAVESTKIDQQHVMSELMRNLRQETNGRTLGEYLESFAQSAPANKFTFNDMALELFTRSEVLSYEQPRSAAGGIGGMIGDLTAHPLATYGKRVLFVLLRAMCRLKLNIPTSVSNKLFAPSVPSWVEEDTETGMINCDEATKRRIAEAKDNITRMLLRRRDKLESQRQIAAKKSEAAARSSDHPPSSPPAAAGAAAVQRENSATSLSADDASGPPADELRATSPEDSRSKVGRYLEQHASAAVGGEGNDSVADDELCTVDTESFVAFPATSALVQARSMSALRHMESTVQQVKEADLLQPAAAASSSSPAAKNPSRLVSDYELWQTLQQSFSDETKGGGVISLGAPTAKRLRFSANEDDGAADNDDRDPPVSFAVGSTSAQVGSPEPLETVASATVANIRTNDRDLAFLARSGYDDELGLQLDDLDDMLDGEQLRPHAVDAEPVVVPTNADGDSADNFDDLL